jgi:preprotein translocase SecE subunit
LADSTGFAPYRPGQGVYARGAAAGAVLLLALFGSWRLYVQVRGVTDKSVPLLGMQVPYAALWAAAAFVLMAAVIFLFTFGLGTGLKSLDARTQGLIDLLIDTEAELAKVSWPSSEVLSRSTAAVLVAMVLLGIFLFCVDSVVAFVMGALRVLPH